jgi:hypothetical protein
VLVAFLFLSPEQRSSDRKLQSWSDYPQKKELERGTNVLFSSQPKKSCCFLEAGSEQPHLGKAGKRLLSETVRFLCFAHDLEIHFGKVTNE